MEKTKIRKAKGFEEGNFSQKVMEKQTEKLEEMEKNLKNKLKIDFGKEESLNVYKKVNELLVLCEEKGKNEESLRIMEQDYSLFTELMTIVEERAGKKILMAVNEKKLKEDFKRKGEELKQKIEVKRKQVQEMLGEAVKKKNEKKEYGKIIGEIVYRRTHNKMNEIAIIDLEKEKKIGEKLVDTVAVKRIRLAVDYGMNVN